MPSFDPFRRFRLRTVPVPVPTLSSEEDSDESSPEHDQPRVIHFPAAKHTRMSGECLVSIPDTGMIPRGAPEKMFEGAHISLTFRNTPVTERTAKDHKSVVASDSVPALSPPAKQTLIRRVTSKLHISIPLKSSTDGLRSRPSTRTLPADMNPPTQRPRPPRAQKPVSSTLPNSFVSREHREAALRERGLLPPRKDFSQQEREADQRLAYIPSPTTTTFGGSTEAERFKASWLATHRTSESTESDCGPPHESGTTPSPAPLDAVSRKSSESRTDVPCAGRPSFCSSLPPLTTSYLEVLHEDPSEQGPITPPPTLPPSNPPIIVSSPLDYSSLPMIVDSPISCTFSSNFPGSTLESLSQSDHPPPVPKKDNMYSPASRRRTVDSDDRPRKVVGLSRLGTRSLTNLRRSVADSLKRQSTSTLSSADYMVQVPRTAISPTIHSMASILRETRDIADAESRRLSELAFLD